MRVQKAIESCEVSEILGIFDKYFINDEENFNEEVFIQIMNSLIDLLMKNGIKDINFLTKLKMTLSPFKYLDKNLDFGLFYEHEV